MARLKWLWIGLFWIVGTALLLEIVLRITSGSLPGQVGVAARYVTTGQPYAESWTPAWRENRDHYYTLRPNIQNALQYGTPSVNFRLTTHKLWDDGLPADEGIGFRTAPIDYTVDAVVVGDSFGFCFTELEDCWVNLLAQETGLGIANLSQPVTGTISHGRMLQEFGAPLTPPLVIWQFFGNDFNDDYGLLAWRGEIEPITDALDTPTAPPSTNPLVDTLRRHSALYAVGEVLITGRWQVITPDQIPFISNYTATYGNGEVLHFGKLYERLALDMSRPANQFGLAQSQAAFQAAQELIATWDGRLIVVIIPTREEVYDFLTEPIMGQAELDKQRSARLSMLTLCDALQLECIDPLAAFQERAQAGEALYYSDDMHLNPVGNRYLAQIIQATIE